MTNKIKLKDRLKSWLVTLGIASVFGLAALGVCAANSYQKASAYEYQDNGLLSFSTDFDLALLMNYARQYGVHDEEYENYYLDLTYCYAIDDVSFEHTWTFLETYDYDDIYFGFYTSEHPDSDYYVTYSYSDDVWSLSDNVYPTGYDISLPLTFYVTTESNIYYSLLNYVLSYNAPQNSGNFVTALTSFMSLIGGGIVDLAQTIGAGVVSFASGLFLDSGHLSILGGIIGIFCGIALAVTLTSKVYAWISTLGN